MIEINLENPVPRAPATPARSGLRERNKRDKQERIARAAAELFRERGYDATTGRQVCERAGIGTGTLFLYVRDKRELLSLIFAPLAEGVFRRLRRGLDPDESFVDGLMRLFGAFYRLYARDPALSRLFVQELLFRDDPDERHASLAGELERRVGEVLAEASRRGQLRADVSLESLGRAVAAHYVLSIQLWLGTGRQGRRAAERSLRDGLELLRDGIGARVAGGAG